MIKQTTHSIERPNLKCVIGIQGNAESHWIGLHKSNSQHGSKMAVFSSRLPLMKAPAVEEFPFSALGLAWLLHKPYVNPLTYGSAWQIIPKLKCSCTQVFWEELIT
uniref:Uncharacterized protein n=1 Tax=Sphaerodactylus townsendi TaxID=933632 RepID=A0ACB8EYQ2_9SAUR